ncbi:MAG: serine/threonine-protein kinase [Myxococcota bacterium]
MDQGDVTRRDSKADPRIGMVLQDRYRIVRQLGEGGMGAVYEGEHLLIKRRVAIKALHAQFATNPAIVKRFHNEALAATAIGHENIIEVTDMGRFDDGSVFMVLEYLDGRDWADDLEATGPQPVGRVVRILLQVCDALEAAHAKGIVHRDLKPENIFLIRRSGNPDFAKVLDFGISKMKDAAGPGSAMTRTGTTLGTPYYMAPEQAQGKKSVDHRADLYSLGVILFQALTTQYPFDDESYPMLVLKICTEPAPNVREFRPDVPAEIANIVARLLAKDPEHRYQNCASLKAALAPFAGLDADPVTAKAQATADRPAAALASDVNFTGGMTLAAPGFAPNTEPEPEAAPAMVAAPTPVVSAGATATPQPAAAHETTPDVPARGARLPLVLGLVLLVAGGAALAIAASLGGESAGDADVAEVVAPAPSGAEGSGATTPTEAAERVRITIRTEPPGAELFLDGDPIANPFEAELPSADAPRHLEARLEGHTTVLRDVVMKYPQSITIPLTRGAGTEDQRAASMASAMRRVRRPAAAMSSSGEMRAAVAPSDEARRMLEAAERMERAADQLSETAMQPRPDEPPPSATKLKRIDLLGN